MKSTEHIRLGWEEIRSQWRRRRDQRTEKRVLRMKAQRPPWGMITAIGLSVAAAILYCVLAGGAISVAHVDLGDGNYLYTSGRMADGLTIYKDFLSPQPPMHLLVGSALVKYGRSIEEGMDNPKRLDVPLPLLFPRIFVIALRLITALFVFLIANRIAQSAFGGFLAVLFFLFLPTGFYWAQGYQSEHLEILFLMHAFWLFIQLRPSRMFCAGVLMALAVLTNMTAAPYALALLTYLAVRHALQGGRKGIILTLCYFLPLTIVWSAVAFSLEAKTGAYFLNTVSNQVASYPPEGFWGYGFPKLLRESLSVLIKEAGFLVLALLGLSLYNRSDKRIEREFLVWYALVLLLSIAYVTKGGTMDYIFVLGEPVVAIFAAYFLTQFLHPATHRRFLRQSVFQDTSIIPQAAFLLLLAFVTVYPSFHFIQGILRHDQVEQRPEPTRRLTYLIERHSKPEDRILAPPYYAFLSGRKLFEEYAELYLWKMKYFEERTAGRAGEGVLKVRAIEAALNKRELPVVVADAIQDVRETPYSLILFAPELFQALQKNYKPLLREDQIMQTRNFRLQVYLPKTDEELTENAAP
jgi:hypothetical protein